MYLVSVLSGIGTNYLASCYLAVKHASAAMKQTNEARGKPLSGGSIILTASSLYLFYFSYNSVLNLRVTVAGIRSGAGSTDCKSDMKLIFHL